MPNLAIVLGNSTYQNLPPLPCCHDDLAAIRELLEATGKYSNIVPIQNVPANEAKDTIRAAIRPDKKIKELFFYFTGHGFQTQNDFYHCSSDFDQRNPNQTGLSLDDLHVLLRMAEADVVVKVIDACNSGRPLIKSDRGYVFPADKGFKMLVQFASCLDSQTSLTGDPLSAFTQKFRDAALSKIDGPVYYMDIVASLRDYFEDNNSQTPFFIAQGTGREQFVNDAGCLSALRSRVYSDHESRDSTAEELNTPSSTRHLVRLLEDAEGAVATPEKIDAFVSAFFAGVVERASSLSVSDFFEMNSVEHSGFVEPSTREFITKVMSEEKRQDNFVTASVDLVRGDGSPTSVGAALLSLAGDYNFRYDYSLDLNYPMQRAQLRLVLKPRYRCLKQIVLILTCAPSLENCYIFEIGSEHRLKNPTEFDAHGEEIVRRWYKRRWDSDTTEVIDKIAQTLEETVKGHLEDTRQRLAAGDEGDGAVDP